ncbi:MAG TPA: hypothetical protein VLW85_03525, partial [Myxococcales bacterium]|nr:hypothetical protein [Myxococcales bacterium]
MRRGYPVSIGLHALLLVFLLWPRKHTAPPAPPAAATYVVFRSSPAPPRPPGPAPRARLRTAKVHELRPPRQVPDAPPPEPAPAAAAAS